MGAEGCGNWFSLASVWCMTQQQKYHTDRERNSSITERRDANAQSPNLIRSAFWFESSGSMTSRSWDNAWGTSCRQLAASFSRITSSQNIISEVARNILSSYHHINTLLKQREDDKSTCCFFKSCNIHILSIRCWNVSFVKFSFFTGIFPTVFQFSSPRLLNSRKIVSTWKLVFYYCVALNTTIPSSIIHCCYGDEAEAQKQSCVS